VRIVSGRQAVREQLADLLTDESRYSEGTPEKVFFPESVEDVRTAVNAASRENRAITLIGAHTGIAGGSVPTDGCVAIGFSSMNRILRTVRQTPDSALLECEPGVTLEAIGRFLDNPAAWPGPAPEGELPERNQFFYPPDPTEMGAELGGTVATNASGARSYRFGATRAHIEAVSIVLASGETATFKRGSCAGADGVLTFATDRGAPYKIPLPPIPRVSAKNAAGYFVRPAMDLVDLLIGSEGTLAIFSSITVRIRRRPDFVSGLSFFPSREAAFAFAGFLRQDERVAAIEYFDPTALALLAEHRSGTLKALPEFSPGDTAILWEFMEEDGARFDGSMDRWESALSGCGSSFDATLAGFDDQGQERLRVFRHAVPEFVNNRIALNKSKVPSIRKISTDAAVPLERFEQAFFRQIQAIEQAGLKYVVFGHLGDGHLHFNLIPNDDNELERALATYEILMNIALENNGTVSAEHGIGKLKRKYLLKMYGDEAVRRMWQIKTAFDPQNRLNPGNLFM
jgi:D-lactate dehydrogenase (cytochrome)